MGKYRVERVLGAGGMGVVVEATHLALDERVALKFLLPAFAKSPEAAVRFAREARAAAKIKSDCISNSCVGAASKICKGATGTPCVAAVDCSSGSCSGTTFVCDP